MTLLYRLLGIPGNSIEMKEKVDRKIEKLISEVKKRNQKVNITQQLEAYSIKEITHYNCYIQINSKGVRGSVSVPVLGRRYKDEFEDDPRILQMKNNDYAVTYELALDFAKRFNEDGLEVLIDDKSIEEIKDLIPKIRNGEVQLSTIRIPSYGSSPI